MRWPWSKPRIVGRLRPYEWPKKVYFLDGPLRGEVREGAGPGYEVVILYISMIDVKAGVPSRNTLTWEFPGFLMSDPPKCSVWRYAWETAYPRAQVAYVRFVG